MPVEVEDLKFLRANTSRTIKITVPGPFTMAQQAQDDYYGSHAGVDDAPGQEALRKKCVCGRSSSWPSTNVSTFSL